MTKDQILELAKQCALPGWIMSKTIHMGLDLEKFAHLVAVQQREIDADIVAGAAPGFCGGRAETVLYTIADHIRIGD